MSSCIQSPLLSYSNFSLHRGLLGLNQGEFFSSHSFIHYSNKSYETEWSFLNHKKGNKNLGLKDTYMYICDRKTENKSYYKTFLVWKPEPPMVNILTTYRQ